MGRAESVGRIKITLLCRLSRFVLQWKQFRVPGFILPHSYGREEVGIKYFFMLDAKDIEILRGMFRENNEVFGRQLKREMRDEIHSVVHGAVSAAKREMLDEMAKMEDRMITAIHSLVDDQITPQIDGLDTRVTRLERLSSTL